MYYDERRRFGLLGGILLIVPGLAYLGAMRGCDMAREINKSIEEGQRQTHAKDPRRWLDKLESAPNMNGNAHGDSYKDEPLKKGEWDI